MDWYNFRPYVSVGQRRANALRHIARLQKTGHQAEPVHIDGRRIARTFWGKAWCDHLESYSDFTNRLPRGRTYVRNGSVVDLQIKPGKITALVAGSEVYEITIGIKPAPSQSWTAIKRACAGQIGSLIDLLRGKLSDGVMRIITARDGGLFPKPGEIELDCSCPDSAGLCKHLAAVLYGVGARLDGKPELLFLLRRLDHLELLSQAGDLAALTTAAPHQKTIATGEISDVFGIDLDDAGGSNQTAAAAEKIPAPPANAAVSRKNPAKQKPAWKKTAAGRPVSPASKKAGKGAIAAARLSIARARQNVASAHPNSGGIKVVESATVTVKARPGRSRPKPFSHSQTS